MSAETILTSVIATRLEAIGGRMGLVVERSARSPLLVEGRDFSLGIYDAEGVLQFAGGITGSRSHAGDNAGRRSLVALMSDGAPERAATSVYGCPLFATSGI